MVRSNADPSVDMYNVDNPVTLMGYLGREQYGDWPVLFGPDYVDKVENVENGDQYVKAKTTYEIAGKNFKRDWSSAPSAHLFPRMWDSDNDRGQMDSFKAFAGVEDGTPPTLRDNIKYFTNYQFGFMYLRYFLWNFAGKQNDLQGFGNVRDGNFSTGISFIDNFIFGDQSKLPDSIKNNNKAHNSLFMLPFLLGILGFIFQYQKNKKDFIVTGLLFFFTGIAIVIYLVFFQNNKLAESTEKLVLVGNALMASMVALLGLFLSKQDAYDTDTLNLHKWGGLSIALISCGLIYLKNIATSIQKIIALTYLLVLLFFTHQGAILTHGENALSIPSPEVKLAEEVKTVDSSLTVYEKAIAPILAQKCVSCHGPDKVKGQLQLQSPELIIKGGKNGSILNGIQNEEAQILQRIHLPNADKKHMPPDGKLQLTLEELTLLSKWVKAGGNLLCVITKVFRSHPQFCF